MHCMWERVSNLYVSDRYTRNSTPRQSSFPDIPEEPYDLVVLGSGPAGETAGCKAAQLGAKVCPCPCLP